MFHDKYHNVVGVDVASQKLDVYHLQQNTHRTIDNSATAIKKFVRQTIDSDQTNLVVMEATGGYETPLLESLLEAEIDCQVVNPLRVRQFARACGKLEKTDEIDAKIIAKFGATIEPTLKSPLSPARKKLGALVHRRDQIVSQQQAEQNRVKQTTDPIVSQMIDAAIALYQQQLKEINRLIAQTIASCEELSTQAEILGSCCGVGPVTIGVLLAELPELGQLNRGEVAKLVGVAPLARDSGLKERKRKTHAGRGLVRKVLYMAALVCTQKNPRFKEAYRKLLERGKAKKVALVAIMRKLIVTLNAMIKNQKKWEESECAY